MSKIIKQVSSLEPSNQSSITIKVKSFSTHLNSDPELLDDSLKEVEHSIITNAKLEAQDIINKAKAEAEDRLSEIENQKNQWQMEREHLIQKASEEGFQLGFDQGQQNGYEEYKELIDQAKGIIAQSKQAFIDHIESSEETILLLSLEIAEKIIKQSLSNNAELFIPLVTEALKTAREFKEVHIYVHPSQFELLQSEKAGLNSLIPGHINLYIYPDADLEEFSCQIESDFGRIDASVTSQLNELKGKLLKLLEGADE